MKPRAMRRLVAIFAGIAFAVAALAGVQLVLHGVQARPPGKWETRIASFAKHSLLVGNKNLKNPLPATADNSVEGQQNFSHYCFACHGLDGQNTGVPFADAMSPPVPSLASGEVQRYTDGQLHWIIRNGLWPSGMPAARGILTDEEIWSIVVYLRNLPRAASLGEPPAYSGEDCAQASEHVSPPRHKQQPSRTAPSN
jgi:mono/diheme cytochrome c family protein